MTALRGYEMAAVSIVMLMLYVSYLGVVALINRRVEKKLREKLRKFNLLPESVRQDSPFFMSVPPPCQFSVFLVGETSRKLIGHGYRYENHLVMPAHVLGEFPSRLMIATVETGPKGLEYGSLIPVADFEWRTIMADVAVAHLGAKQIPKLKKAIIAPYWGKPLVSISTGFKSDNSSVGIMKEFSFGILEYTGSTRAGFSGSTYLLENKVVAMHLGGGVANLAVSASYLANLIKANESSDVAALKRAMKRARKNEISWATTGDPDMIEVCIRGRYFRVEMDDFDEAYYDQYQDAYDYSNSQGPRDARERQRWRYDDDDDFVPWQPEPDDEEPDLAERFGQGDYQEEGLIESLAEILEKARAKLDLEVRNVSIQTDIRRKTSDSSTQTQGTWKRIKDTPKESVEVYKPESVSENAKRPAQNTQGGPKSTNASPTCSQPDKGLRDFCMKSSKTLERILGQTVDPNSLLKALRSTTSSQVEHQNKLSRRQKRSRATSPPFSQSAVPSRSRSAQGTTSEVKNGPTASKPQSVRSTSKPRQVLVTSNVTKQ